MSFTAVVTPLGHPNSMTVDITVSGIGGLVAPWDVVIFFTDAGGEVPLVLTTSLPGVTVRHTYLSMGPVDIVVRVIPHGDDPYTAQPDEFSEEYDAEVPFKGMPRLRQFPRDDALGGAPRQSHSSQSVQSTARQGWAGTYR